MDVEWKLTQKCTLCRVGHKGKVHVYGELHIVAFAPDP